MHTPLLYFPEPLSVGAIVELPQHAAKHVQVLRLQPDSKITLFQGGLPADDSTKVLDGCYTATVVQITRKTVQVRIDAQCDIQAPKVAPRVRLACCVPANERMDWVVEKATELGVHSIQPLLSARSVVRLSGERASRRVAHWQSIAISACEQSKRLNVPQVKPLCKLANWLQTYTANNFSGQLWVLSLQDKAKTIKQLIPTGLSSIGDILILSGPEGGLTVEEEFQATNAGFCVVSLGQHVLRADTAPIVALAAISALT